ncbi:hypothetical protein C9I98_07595 [Photobacterium sanctipauli]|uniref:DUF2157 domain-containing protein n=2 Tax=Photobacterium sanctipauli TaxID=1342794 RepID=A0A2T3NXC2_9GAMM|nr:hypothetical protein C9I98_07595 [Photobacterium sanctipauli]
MKISKRQEKTLSQAIQHWEDEQTISEETAEQLRNSYEVVGFDWKLIAVYSFWIAITCFIISIGVLLADDYLMELLAKLIDTPASVLAVISAMLAAGVFWLGQKRRTTHPDKHISNEAIYFFGVLFTAVSVGFMKETALFARWDDPPFLLLLTVVYGILAIRLPSTLVWIFSLFGFAWWGLEQTHLWESASGHFFGLNQPLRLVVAGIIVLLAGRALARTERYQPLADPTRFIGYFYLLFALWLVSIVGNYGDGAAWSKVSQLSLIHWAILSGVVCLILIYHGIQHEDKIARSFGITFLLINLYTRYFEYFWDAMHKTLFFAILALSFWLIGTKAEKLWQVSHNKS